MAKKTSFWQKASTQKQMRAIVLIAVAAITIVGLTLLALELTDSSSSILFINDSECPEVTLTLIEQTGAERIEVSLRPGEQEEIEISPDIGYEYILDTESDEDTQGGRCLERETGALSVPRGSTQTIRVQSTRTVIIFENDEACPETSINIDSQVSGEGVKDGIVGPGESEEFVISANTTYEYTLTAQEADPNNCLAENTGTVRIEANQTKTIRLAPTDN